MKKNCFLPLALAAALALPCLAGAQVNSGSNGSDGAFNPTQNVVIDMADHPDGIYHYTSVNVPSGVTVTFKANVGNKPVVWLVQGDCVIDGLVDVSGGSAEYGGNAGPGGGGGGNGGTTANNGKGPGGGKAARFGGNGSHSTPGTIWDGDPSETPDQGPAGAVYGDTFLLPLVGGSGGGGAVNGGYGSGGGGAILIAASGTITLNGQIGSQGGHAVAYWQDGAPRGFNGPGAGSGGAVRLVASRISGAGFINTDGGSVAGRIGYSGADLGRAGAGRVRLDTYENSFRGGVNGTVSQGFQPIIIAAPGQGMQLAIQSVGGNAVSTTPSGALANPDVIISAQHQNPIPVVVKCTNVPLNSEITVVVHPANGPDVQAVGINSSGNTASSTATVALNMPRGGGIIYAKAVTGVTGGSSSSASASKDSATRSYLETGLTADGERFTKVETKAALGGKQETTFVTESGNRLVMPN